MARTALTGQGGALTKGNLDAINANSSELYNRSDAGRLRSYWYEDFSCQPNCWVASVAGAVPSRTPGGTSTVASVLHTGNYNLEMCMQGGADQSDNVMPYVTTDAAYDIGSEQVLAYGMEILFGSVLNARHPRNLTAGTDDGYSRIRISAADASGVDIVFGYRKIEAFTGALATYTDLAGLRILGDSSSAAAAMSVVTNLNDATDVTSVALTNTLADATAVELDVRVSDDGSVSWYVDQQRVAASTAFVFDDTDVLTPFLFFLNTTDLGGEVKLLRADGGPLNTHPGVALA